METVANDVLASFKPADDVMLDHKRHVVESARRLGLSEDVAKTLALEACKGEWWATKKFKKFLMENVSESFWNEPDELFHGMQFEGLPKRDNLERTLGKIYDARSKATHEGKPFPVTASYTGGPTISTRAADALYGAELPFPPVVWFERIVNSALSGLWERSMPTDALPEG